MRPAHYKKKPRDLTLLSPAQQRVYDQIVNHARTQKEIAEQLGISVSTVREHVRIIYRKKNVKNAAQLILQHWKHQCAEELGK